MVGHHIFAGEQLKVFQHGADTQDVRVIRDEAAFRLTVDPPPSATPHHYHQHRQPNDPPVSSPIQYTTVDPWASPGRQKECNYVVSDPPVAYSSLSSLFKRTILSELAIGPRWPSIAHRICHTNTLVDRHVDGGRLHAILTRATGGLHDHHRLPHTRLRQRGPCTLRVPVGADRRRPLVRRLAYHQRAGQSAGAC
mmetsp:Transcript_40064/g.114155  ORF Transcript_40064/g.114155 Transcript_40064/m.114155 type:complete len:195 (+) Transcript_40064:440-1024(+)